MPRVARLVLLSLVAVSILLSGAVAPATARPRPLQPSGDAPDPSVVAAPTSGLYVAIATGKSVTRWLSTDGRHWTRTRPALAGRPGWARRGGGVWASDMAQVGNQWVLYFAAPVRGMRASSRCIGVAVAASPTDRFRPMPGGPLVCPGRARTPRPQDDMVGVGRRRPALSAHGAIDPSFLALRGRNYLLYKTDGVPSSIRAVELTADGLATTGRPSTRLVASAGTVENPVIFKRGRFYYLLTSTGSYRTCDYATTWRRSRKPFAWKGRGHVLLGPRRTGLCGPGGADVVKRGGRLTAYFHGWVCGRHGKPCRGAGLRHPRRSRAHRALYGVELRFVAARVRAGRFMRR